MTTRTRTILLCIALVALLVLACDWNGDPDAWRTWQAEVNSRQRGLEQPTATLEVPQ